MSVLKPFNRIVRYNTHRFNSTSQPVHVIVKCDVSYPNVSPLCHSFLYTVPFKTEKRELFNAVLGFADNAHATYFLDALKAESLQMQNKNEPNWNAMVMTYAISEVSYYGYMMGCPVVMVNSMQCDDKIREPCMEVCVAYGIVNDEFLVAPIPKNMY
jgi:predicted N-formylglutamate amidohydrolase